MIAMISPHFWHAFIFYGKVVGAAASFVTFAGLAYRYLIHPVIRGVSTINKTITEFATNHLPHLQSTLDKHSQALEEIKSDNQKQNETLVAYGVRLDSADR